MKGMRNADAEYDFSDAVDYHYDRFPPTSLDANQLIKPLAKAVASLARYDQMLKGLHDSEILLAPLRSQEAVVSSRMEGTVSTLDEVLRYEADKEGNGETVDTKYRGEAIEVYLYSRALKNARRQIEEGKDISSWLIRATHQELLSFGRGAQMTPGNFKTEQNYQSLFSCCCKCTVSIRDLDKLKLALLVWF